MVKELLWLGLSAIYAFGVIIIAAILAKKTKLESQIIRKIIHIGVSLWVFFPVYTISNIYLAILFPIIFIFTNTYLTLSGRLKMLGMGERKKDNGLIYYPISLTILILLAYLGVIEKSVLFISILVMGIGDGMAGIIGLKKGKHKYKVINGEKSIEGSIVMLCASILVIGFFGDYSNHLVVLIALVATLAESITPYGLDNITVPLLTALMGAIL